MGADETTMPSFVIQGRRPEPGKTEVLVDEQTTRHGLQIGSTISINDGPDLEVVGVAKDAGFGFTTAWADHDVFDKSRRGETGIGFAVRQIASIRGGDRKRGGFRSH